MKHINNSEAALPVYVRAYTRPSFTNPIRVVNSMLTQFIVCMRMRSYPAATSMAWKMKLSATPAQISRDPPPCLSVPDPPRFPNSAVSLSSVHAPRPITEIEASSPRCRGGTEPLIPLSSFVSLATCNRSRAISALADCLLIGETPTPIGESHSRAVTHRALAPNRSEERVSLTSIESGERL
jgi:hypothetical protein